MRDGIFKSQAVPETAGPWRKNTKFKVFMVSNAYRPTFDDEWMGRDFVCAARGILNFAHFFFLSSLSRFEHGTNCLKFVASTMCAPNLSGRQVPRRKHENGVKNSIVWRK